MTPAAFVMISDMNSAVPAEEPLLHTARTLHCHDRDLAVEVAAVADQGSPVRSVTRAAKALHVSRAARQRRTLRLGVVMAESSLV